MLALKDINIKIPKGKVTMIVGQIGSGKSSLLQAVLNEMTPDLQKNPKIVINGTIAYSAQKPWIISGSIKENILFGGSEDKRKLREAIKYACLEEDLKILHKGIDT